MLAKLNIILSGLGMTIIAGIFLLTSLLQVFEIFTFPLDPAWGSIIICGFPLLYLAIKRLIFQKWISSALLISIAMLAAIGIGELFAAGEVAFIMSLGAILEDKTVEKAQKGLRKLIELRPMQARRLNKSNQQENTDIEEMVLAKDIIKGDILRVLPGEIIPVDGEIIMGTTSINQSAITGEFLPIDKNIGDSVFSGTINQFGVIDIKAVMVGENSSLQKLIRIIKEAEHKKAPMQRIADKWATWLVPVILVISIITFLMSKDIVRAVTMLVVFCPCALALATPTSIMAAIGQAAQQGVIIKSGEALETTGKVDTIAFDKTGTLTQGNLIVTDIISFSNLDKNQLLSLVASAETSSEHPFARALINKAHESKLTIKQSTNFKMVAGKGIQADIDGETIFCGNTLYIEENTIKIPKDIISQLDTFRLEGKALLFVATNTRFLGAICLSDTIKKNAEHMIQALKKTKTNIILLSGDHSHTAQYIAKQTGIKTIHAELLPEDKLAHIENLQKSGHKVCMIGDGINDAPALKIANVGVAMGSMGSDIAIEAADIALIGDDITKIPYLKKLADATLKTIKYNIGLSMCINTVAVILSALGFLNPITGAIVHNVGSVLVVLNAALLYDRKF